MQSRCKTERTTVMLSYCFLILFGLVMIYSAGKYSGESTYNDEWFFVKKQAVGIVIGVAFAFLFYKLDVKVLQRYATVLYVIAAVLLILVFVPVIGVENYGAKRWINLGFFTIQPSEIAKFAFILLTAAYMSKNYEKMGTVKGLIVPVFAALIYCVLIMLEPNMSITICMLAIMLGMLIVGGMRIKYLVILCVLALALLPILIIVEPYRLLRLLAFIDPFKSPKGEGYQLLQSLYAVSNGGLFGVGLFNSRQALKFLPFAESDFIFAIICEELGFVGGACIIGVFLAIFYSGIKIAYEQKDRFLFYLAFGISFHLIVQVAMNVSVVLGLIPPTGLPLPLISSGNTQIISFSTQIGILCSIGKESSMPLLTM